MPRFVAAKSPLRRPSLRPPEMSGSVLTNERRVLRVLTNERTVLPGHSAGSQSGPDHRAQEPADGLKRKLRMFNDHLFEPMKDSISLFHACLIFHLT